MNINVEFTRKIVQRGTISIDVPDNFEFSESFDCALIAILDGCALESLDDEHSIILSHSANDVGINLSYENDVLSFNQV